MKIKLIRLLAGEELIAEVQDETKDLVLKNVMRVVVMPNQLDPKNPTVGLAPFLRWSDTDVLKFNRDVVVTVADPLPEFVDQYKKMTSSIIQPDSTLILP